LPGAKGAGCIVQVGGVIADGGTAAFAEFGVELCDLPLSPGARPDRGGHTCVTVRLVPAAST
jgi:hypothetical protein